MKKIAALLILMISCQGCMAAAVAYGLHKHSEAKTESAEKAQRSKDLETYTKYRTEMEKVNTDREKSGLKRQPIIGQEEWISAQTAGRPAIAPVVQATKENEKH